VAQDLGRTEIVIPCRPSILCSMVSCSYILLTAMLAALCGLSPMTTATTDVPPSLIEEFKVGKTDALLDFLRTRPPDLDTSQLIHDEIKTRLKKKDDFTAKSNKIFAKGTKAINDMVRSSIRNTIREGQENIDKQVRLFKKCEKGRRTRIRTAKAHKKSYKKHSSAHRSCRKDEHRLWKNADACASITKSRTRLHAASLKGMKAYRLRTENDCVKMFNESDFAYATRMRNKFKSDYKQFMRLKEKHLEIVETLQETEKTCTAVDEEYWSVKDKCDKTAELMDSNACNYAYHTQKACNHFEECRPMYYGSWKAAKESVEKLSHGLPKQWLVTSKTVCLLNLFKKKKTQNDDMDKCEDCRRGHCSEWETDIDFRKEELPLESSCKVPRAFPCNKAYYSLEYGKLPRGVEVSCLACEGILLREGKLSKKEKKDEKDDEKKDDEEDRKMDDKNEES